MLSTAYNFLYVHVPKTGGNSIQSVLAPYADDVIVSQRPDQDGVDRFAVRSDRFNTRKHSTLAEYRAAYGDALFRALRKFCCVRNPWDRAVSHFLSPGRIASTEARDDFLEFVRSPVVKPLEYYLAASDCDGPDLARAVSGLSCIIRFEHLQGDFDRACDVIGLPRSVLPHRNRGLRRAYAEYYCGEARQVVADRCASEIELFGYEFEG